MKYCCRFFATRQCNFVAENNQENHAINTVQTALLEPQLRSDKLSLPSQPANEAQCGTKICPMMFVETYDGSVHCTHDCCKCDIHLHPPLEETLGSHSDDLGRLPACRSVCRSSKKSNCCFQCLLLSMSMLDIVRSFLRCQQVHPCSISLPSAWEVLSLRVMCCGSGATRAASGLTGMEYCCRCGFGFRNAHAARRTG